MRIEKYIKILGEQGIFISIKEGDELKVKAREELLTKQLISEIKSRKNEILNFYKNFSGNSDFSAIPTTELKTQYKLSSSQQRLHFIYEYDRNSIAYNLPYVVDIKGVLDREFLGGTFEKLLKRHEGLRTYFNFINDELVQIIEKSNSLKIEHYESNESVVGSVIKEFIRPFDLGNAPLIRVGLVRLSEE
ncbi:condensation domain-containing protein, partial [Maribacter sp. 2307UL18-2]|uniref:condensation domain-containing protein n=1 Tax=Maribacter sp. 2307UL18-2 TaxID=3386274 RepID=UPI0039BC49BB